MNSLFAECSDLELRCRDCIIRANKFNMLAKCPVIRQMHEMRPGNEILLLDIPSSWPRITVDILHYLKNPAELDMEEAVIAREAFHFFGCRFMQRAISKRIWHLRSLKKS